MRLSYNSYSFSLREWIQYSVTCLLLCFLVNDLCYRSLISFFLLLPFCFLYLPFKKKQLLAERRKRLYHQFRDALNSINAAVSAGYSLENAVSEARKDLTRIYGTTSEMVLELSYMEAQMRLSVPVEKLFYELGQKSHVEDIRNFSEIIAQAKRTGGNLRETLEKSARIIEEKIDVKKEIDSLLSAKKMEHTFMSLMPAGIIFYMRLTSPGFLDVLYHNAAGVCIMTICLLIYITAFLFGRRMVQIEI